MSDIAIKIEGINKAYRIGLEEERHETLFGAAVAFVKSPLSNFRNLRKLSRFDGCDHEDVIWALRDVSFEVKQGEAVGIIGHNGAGKSTLLKILALITEPTSGRATIYGRIGSLLEVGTGFHQDLTGRENTYLNGTILGMRKKEIDAKFDEIVDFSGIEKFIDTPVKRYSSGMRVRLAFSVAAHLEPEILIIDEVLAVGDADFQKKCLGKMNAVARTGRTVLFVSHNMQAVRTLCETGYEIEGGRIVRSGKIDGVIDGYLAQVGGNSPWKEWSPGTAPGNEELRLTRLCVASADGNRSGRFSSNVDLEVEMQFECKSVTTDLCVGFDLVSSDGTVVLRSYQTDSSRESWPELKSGRNRLVCVIPAGILNGGSYVVIPKISRHNLYWLVNADSGVGFDIVLEHGVSPLWNTINGKHRPGITAPIFDWKAIPAAGA